MKISFYGAAREVTGSCHLLESGGTKILLDCGLFQGDQEVSDLNFSDFGFDPKTINAVVVSHAHLDHIGRIPKLAREGFTGKIYSTAPTRDIARLILEDALSIAERKDDRLYEHKDIEKAFALWETAEYGGIFKIDEIEIKFLNAGHILGSASVEIKVGGEKLFFTGDFGNNPSVLLPSPDIPKGLDYLITESTYGDRAHETLEERALRLERTVEDTASRRGVLIIPAFAAERTQDILFLLNEILLFHRAPEIPVFVDAPLATKITQVYEKYVSWYKDGIQKLYLEHPNLFRCKKLKFTESVEESKAINDIPPPKVIITGSGMLNGGRVLHHLRRYLGGDENIILIVGYQAFGSLGRRLLEGERSVRIFGEEIAARAEIRKINGLSAHADGEQLFALVEANRDSLKRVFVVHGEEKQSLMLAQNIKDRLGILADAPGMGDGFDFS